MNWQTLYSNKRYDSNSPFITESGRGDYLRDYDRIIFSSPFRKLQNKTQVFPLPGTHFVHNRLTHSLEVASVGRTLGKVVGEKIADKHFDETQKASSNFYRFELSDVIQTACLAHDIGNPPFGHFGEEAIRAFFARFFEKNGNLGLTENQQKDFTLFEGNANAFRILTTLFRKSGLKMTYTTLASVVKYPVNSTAGFDSRYLASKKSGFMDSEAAIYNDIAMELGIPGTPHQYQRHPFVFLVEAADDICYRIIDLEDAFKLKIINYQDIVNLLLPLFENDGRKSYLELKLQNPENQEENISLLRALSINLLVEKVAAIFIEQEEALLSGTLNFALIDLLEDSLKSNLQEITRLSVQKIYNHQSVIEKELAGHQVIYGLLEEFCTALVSNENPKSRKTLKLLPTSSQLSENFYHNIQLIVDFVSQMSDEYATELFQKIKGIYR